MKLTARSKAKLDLKIKQTFQQTLYENSKTETVRFRIIESKMNYEP